MSTVSYSYPLHSSTTGPVEPYTVNVETHLLIGVDLDYAYAVATGKYTEIALNFLPGERLEKVRVSVGEGLVSFKRDANETEMRSLVELKLGGNFDVVRLRKA